MRTETPTTEQTARGGAQTPTARMLWESWIAAIAAAGQLYGTADWDHEPPWVHQVWERVAATARGEERW